MSTPGSKWSKSEEERKERRRLSKQRYRNSPKGQATQAALEERTRGKRLIQSRETMLSGYGLSIAAYDALLAKQNNKCAICPIHISESARRFAVDHDHVTGDVRGLLCFRCNAGIGKFNDDPALLKLAVAYLEVPFAKRI